MGKKSKRTVRVICASLCFLIFSNVALAQENQQEVIQEPIKVSARGASQEVTPKPVEETKKQESPLVVRETTLDSSLANSLKKALSENKNLKTANQNLKNELDKFISRNTISVDRIKRLVRMTGSLEKQLEDAENSATKDKEKLNNEINIIKEEKEELIKLLTRLKEKRRADEYYILWMSSESKRISTEAKVKEVAAEGERLKEENGRLHYNLGNLLFKKGDYEKAAYEYKFALKYLPDDSDLFYNLAIVYDYHLEDNQKATQYYDEYLKRQPQAREANLIKERIAENSLEEKMLE